jgi:hypothetical protein
LVIDSPSYRFGAYEALDLTLPALFGSFQIALIDKAPVVSYLCLILMVASLWKKKAQEWLSGRTRLSCFTCPATVRNSDPQERLNADMKQEVGKRDTFNGGAGNDWLVGGF